MHCPNRGMISAFFVVSLAGSGLSLAAESPSHGDKPAILEEIPGSQQKRVVLTERAAERLAIETAQVREEPVTRWLIVGGVVETIAPAGDKPAESVAVADGANAAPMRVRVPASGDDEGTEGQATLALSIGGTASLDDDDWDVGDEDDESSKSAAVLVVPIGGQAKGNFKASLIEVATGADPGAKFYSIDSAGGETLQPGQRVFVRIAQPGSGQLQKVVPYSAVIYDNQGNSWVYANPEPRVFVRQPVTIEYIEKDLAVVTEGPPLGTAVVTTGAAELWGVEQKIGH